MALVKADGGICAGSMGAAFRLWGRRTAAAHGTEGTDAGAAMKGSARTGTKDGRGNGQKNKDMKAQELKDMIKGAPWQKVFDFVKVMNDKGVASRDDLSRFFVGAKKTPPRYGSRLIMAKSPFLIFYKCISFKLGNNFIFHAHLQTYPKALAV